MPTNSIETFVQPWAVDILRGIAASPQYPANEADQIRYLNQQFAALRKNIPTSTRTRWIRSFVSGTAHSATTTSHVTWAIKKNLGVIDKRWSAIEDGTFDLARKFWQRQGEIRYVNTGCYHAPFGDPAIIQLMGMIAKRFEPNAFPVSSDWTDNDRFNPHPTKVSTAVTEEGEEEPSTEAMGRFEQFRTLQFGIMDIVKGWLGTNCVYLSLWGNHEQWVLRTLIGDLMRTDDGVEILNALLEEFMGGMQARGVLWVEADQRKWIPLTKEFWIGHGHRSSGSPGATASGYLRNVTRMAADIAVAHIHRGEVHWVTLPYHKRRFAAVSGSLGPNLRSYNGYEHLGHEWHFQTITYPFEHERWTPVVEDVRITVTDGYYIARYRGDEYSLESRVKYHPLFDY